MSKTARNVKGERETRGRKGDACDTPIPASSINGRIKKMSGGGPNLRHEMSLSCKFLVMHRSGCVER